MSNPFDAGKPNIAFAKSATEAQLNTPSPLMPDFFPKVVDALGLGRPNLVGLSFGGTLALELFRRHPRMPMYWKCRPARLQPTNSTVIPGARYA
jgi:pimeloyl-ACP methyl ester carboxylesterase